MKERRREGRKEGLLSESGALLTEIWHDPTNFKPSFIAEPALHRQLRYYYNLLKWQTYRHLLWTVEEAKNFR